MPSTVFPDVCKTPAPGGPMPVPYPNIGMSPQNASNKVKVKPSNKGFAQHMENLRAAGDADAGAANGVASALKLQQRAVNHLKHSFKVKVQGATTAVLMGRAMMNHAPTKSPEGGQEAPLPHTATLSR